MRQSRITWSLCCICRFFGDKNIIKTLALETWDTWPNADYLWSPSKWRSKIDRDLCVVSLFIMSNQIAVAVLWSITRLQLQVIRDVIDNRKSNWTSISQPLCDTAVWSDGPGAAFLWQILCNPFANTTRVPAGAITWLWNMTLSVSLIINTPGLRGFLCSCLSWAHEYVSMST